MGEETAITPANVGDALRDKVAERIKNDFVDLIPEDVWKKMVGAHIDWFTKDRPQNRFGDNGQESPLKAIIRSELTDRFRKAVQEELGKPEYCPGVGEPSDFVKRFLRDNMQVIMEGAVGSLLQQAVEKFQQVLQSGQRY